MNIFNKFINLVRKFNEIICGVLMLVMITIMATRVFYRYVLQAGLPWIPELARYLLVALSFIGAALALDRDEHVEISFIYEKFSKNKKFILDILYVVIFGIYAVGLTIGGLNYAIRGLDNTGLFVRIPLFYPRLSLPIGGLLIILFLINRFKLSIMNQKNELDI